jgi:glycoprotein endo-alpha-1,2-mannosidase
MDTAHHQSGEQSRFSGTVAVWFTPHHAFVPRDWDNIREFHGAYHPLLGEYKSDDPAVLRAHLRWMRRAGIDLIVYDAYGVGSRTLRDIPNDRTLALLLDHLSSQDRERRRLQLCMWLEKYASNPATADYEFALGYIREHLAHEDFYFRYHGRPLVVTYLNGESDAIDEVEWGNSYFELRRIRPYVSDVWSYVQHYPQRLRKDWMPASPGIDSYLEDAYLATHFRREPSPDYAVIRERAQRADRENGDYYRKQLVRAREANPEIIFVSGWNDWQYGTQIEPAVEYEHLYLDLTAEVLGRRQETATYREQSMPDDSARR